MMLEAKFVARSGHLDWCCASCGRLLGQVYDGRVVIKVGDRYVTFPVDSNADQTCPRCGVGSEIRKSDAA